LNGVECTVAVDYVGGSADLYILDTRVVYVLFEGECVIANCDILGDIDREAARLVVVFRSIVFWQCCNGLIVDEYRDFAFDIVVVSLE
jgi:hypothetical protein